MRRIELILFTTRLPEQRVAGADVDERGNLEGCVGGEKWVRGQGVRGKCTTGLGA